MSHSDQITQDIANILSSKLTPSFSWNNSLRPNKSLSLSHTYIAVFLSCKTRYMHMVHTHTYFQLMPGTHSQLGGLVRVVGGIEIAEQIFLSC